MGYPPSPNKSPAKIPTPFLPMRPVPYCCCKREVREMDYIEGIMLMFVVCLIVVAPIIAFTISEEVSRR